MKSKPRMKRGAMLALAALALVVGSRPAAAGNWVVNNASDLAGAINAANQAGGANTIVLAGSRNLTLTAANNTVHGPRQSKSLSVRPRPGRHSLKP